MVAFNVTVEDTSPLINYSPLEAWIDVLPNDTLANAASRRSLRTTRTAGAKATISFNGTGISVYGIDTAGFGDYAVTVDGRDIRSEAGSRSQNTKRLLGSAYGLSNGPHTAILTSSGSDPVNVDYMDVQHEAAGSLMSMASIDDSDPRVVYQPLSEWQTNTDPDFMNGTLHFSQKDGSSASVSFAGQAIAVYGTVSSDRANVHVSLNGQTTLIPMSAGPRNVKSLHSQVLWYFADGLGPGQHTLSIMSDIQEQQSPFIDVDAFVVYSFNGTTNSGDSNSGSPSRSVPKAAIIGISVGGGVAVIFLLVLLVLLLRKRGSRKGRTEAGSPTTPVLPFQTSQRPDSPFAFPPPLIQSKPSFDRHSIAPSYYASSSLHPQMSYNHSRAGSTTSSTVPMLSVPKPPSSTRATSPAVSDAGAPVRPSRPPGPVLDLDP